MWRTAWLSAGFKPALWMVGVIILLLSGAVAQAQDVDWSMPSFAADIVVHDDASLTVTETITADFRSAKHGIFRNIPWRYATDEGGTMQVPLTIERVERDGKTEPYTTSYIDDLLEVKIGDADVTIAGEHTYVIVYIVQAAVNFFDDHTELYWNATGNDWPVPLEAVSATVRLEPTVLAEDIQGRCLTGEVGSTVENCTATIAVSQASFKAAGEPLTVVVGWPNGIVTKPDNYDQLRSTAGTTAIERAFKYPVIFWGLNIIWPLFVGLWLWRHWYSRGKDAPGKGTIIAQYDPPESMTPGEMGTLFDEHANHRDVIATMVDLAVRGYLTITEVKTKKLIGTSTDFRLDRLTPKGTTPLKDHEKKLLDGLFSDGSSVTLSELKGTFADDVKKIQDHLYTQVRDQGYFTANPNTVRVIYIVVGLVLAGLGFLTIVFGIVGPIVAGLLIAAVGPFMPKRTVKGAAALWHAKGFKLFLEKAEKYRIKWQEKENIFETYLPYAMAFGVADKWTKAFADLQKEPPSWYHGSGNTFNTIMFWSALNSFSTASAKSFAPPAASGGSGFGGGGFSGGGFGGGGGGSW